MKALAASAALALMLAGCAATTAQVDAGPAIAAAVANPDRPAADRERDVHRKPAEIVAFAGVKPGDVVAEIFPGGGYYTRILAKAVGPTGKVYALVPAAFASRPGGMDGINAIAAQYGNVVPLAVDFATLALPEPADLVWTTENYHDMANNNVTLVNDAMFKALKPGGLYFVEDHEALAGTGLAATSTLHRIDPTAVIEQVTAHGFKLDARSDLLANPKDPKNVGVRDPAVQGETQKFALRFRKPG
jgi:predicted methyltransferase